jgi:hypothetical protein
MKNLLAISATLCLASSIALYNCANPPDYPNEPIIEFKNVSKTLLRQGQLNSKNDSLIVSFSFTDGDGDLGDKDSVNIYITDLRDGNVRESRIPFIDPQGAGNGISGDISVQLYTTCCTYVNSEGIKLACESVPVPYDTVVYSISIKDRSGNKSNTIQTPPIVLQCH